MASRQLFLFDEGDVIHLTRRSIPTPQWSEPSISTPREHSASKPRAKWWPIRGKWRKTGRQSGRKG